MTREPVCDPADPHECNGALSDGTVFQLRWKKAAPGSHRNAQCRGDSDNTTPDGDDRG